MKTAALIVCFVLLLAAIYVAHYIVASIYNAAVLVIIGNPINQK